MNDLTDLRDAWGQPEPPSQNAHSAARAALMRQIATGGTGMSAARPPRRRGARLAWLTAGTAMTAALAAAAVFAFAPGATPPGQPANQLSGHGTGQGFLLAAATIAAGKPATSGTYWHLMESIPALPEGGGDSTQSTWTTHDGTMYVRLQDTDAVMQVSQGDGFGVGLSRLTYEELQQLPTDPAALKARISDPARRPSGDLVPEVPDYAMPGMIADGLTDLIWGVPAPPAVRAAAFRALASLPNITDLGKMDGGQALRISFPPPPADKFPGGKVPEGANQLLLVIDPATSMLLSETNYQGTHKIVKAEWTNEMPKIVQAPTK